MTILSNFERLSLINQFKILKQSTEDKDLIEIYDLNIDILSEGTAGLYSIVFEELYKEETIEDHDFVVEVLNLYRDALNSYSRLNESDKNDGLKRSISFKGFDRNNPDEEAYIKYVEKYLYDLDRFKECKESLNNINGSESINSHGFNPSKNELDKFISIRKEIRKNKDIAIPLTKEELEYIFE
ncbi:YfbU family protein [Mammaliicoccus lentus]|uniref:YfbU family protein n=1 Tax=Mammaliicoccus lentus TaxID=42858 RepID=UPI003392A5FE